MPNGEEIPITFDEMKEFFSDENDEQHKTMETAQGKGSVKTLSMEEYRYQAIVMAIESTMVNPLFMMKIMKRELCIQMKQD